MQDRPVRSLAGVDPKLFQQAPYADAGPLVPDTDAHRSIFVVNAHDNHRMLEPRVADAGHCEQQFAG
jgi:hypothetical protein